MGNNPTISFNEESVKKLEAFAKLVGKNPAIFTYKDGNLSAFATPVNMYEIENTGCVVNGAIDGMQFTVSDVSTFVKTIDSLATVEINEEKGALAVRRNKSNFKLALATIGIISTIKEGLELLGVMKRTLEEKTKINLSETDIKEITFVYSNITVIPDRALISFDFGEKQIVSIIDGAQTITEQGDTVYKNDLTKDGYVAPAEKLNFGGFANSVIPNLVSDDEVFTFKQDKENKIKAITSSLNGVDVYTALVL